MANRHKISKKILKHFRDGGEQLRRRLGTKTVNDYDGRHIMTLVIVMCDIFFPSMILGVIKLMKVSNVYVDNVAALSGVIVVVLLAVTMLILSMHYLFNLQSVYKKKNTSTLAIYILMCIFVAMLTLLQTINISMEINCVTSANADSEACVVYEPWGQGVCNILMAIICPGLVLIVLILEHKQAKLRAAGVVPESAGLLDDEWSDSNEGDAEDPPEVGNHYAASTLTAASQPQQSYYRAM